MRLKRCLLDLFDSGYYVMNAQQTIVVITILRIRVNPSSTANMVWRSC